MTPTTDGIPAPPAASLAGPDGPVRRVLNTPPDARAIVDRAFPA